MGVAVDIEARPPERDLAIIRVREARNLELVRLTRRQQGSE
jgi:hypothetical protein